MNFPAFLAAAIASLPLVAHAQSATTTPVGAITLNFPATRHLTSTVIGIPLQNPPVFSGRVAAVSTNTLQIGNANFGVNAFLGDGNRHFLRIRSGAQEGRTILILSHTSDSVTLDVTDNTHQSTHLNLSGFSVEPGDLVEIVPADTIASLFGDGSPQNPLVFTGGTGLLNSDTIGIYNKMLSRHDVFFFSTSLGYWRSSSSSVSQNNRLLYPEESVSVTRRAGRPSASLVITGKVPSQRILTKVTGSGLGYWTFSKVPIDITLGQLTFSGWTKGPSVLSADTIAVLNPMFVQPDVFFQRPDNTWRKLGDSMNEHSNFVIPAGTGFFILKRRAVSGAASYLTMPLPYEI